MALTLVGLGLGSPAYLTMAAIEAMRSSDIVYVERYTGYVSEELLGFLREEVGVKIVEASRAMLEDEGKRVVDEARIRSVCVAAAGDPLVATTHVSLALMAARSGVALRIVHGVSIISAASSASGLMAYKFGRTTTLPKFAEPHSVSTVYRVVGENSQAGLHSLILLDTSEGGLSASRAARLLCEEEGRVGLGLLTEDRLAVVLARLGLEGEVKRAAKLGEVAELDLPEPPHVLIIPGELHFSERDALRFILGCSPELLEGHRPARPSQRRAERYIEGAERVLEVIRNQGLKGGRVGEALELAESYVYDARSFLSSGKLEDSLVAVSYAEGILDCLRLLGMVSFNW